MGYRKTVKPFPSDSTFTQGSSNSNPTVMTEEQSNSNGMSHAQAIQVTSEIKRCTDHFMSVKRHGQNGQRP
jgi:hypothetical protein